MYVMLSRFYQIGIFSILLAYFKSLSLGISSKTKFENYD